MTLRYRVGNRVLSPKRGASQLHLKVPPTPDPACLATLCHHLHCVLGAPHGPSSHHLPAKLRRTCRADCTPSLLPLTCLQDTQTSLLLPLLAPETLSIPKPWRFGGRRLEKLTGLLCSVLSHPSPETLSTGPGAWQQVDVLGGRAGTGEHSTPARQASARCSSHHAKCIHTQPGMPCGTASLQQAPWEDR